MLVARKVSARPNGNVKAFHVHAEFHARGLFPPVDFVTNLALPSGAVVRFYNKRTTVEQWIKEGKLAVNWTRLSWHRFRGNEVRLWLSVIIYNLGTLWRRLALPEKIGN
jgi:DDE family transposase